MILAYLMKSQGMDLKSAYDLVKSKREKVLPNMGFIVQLKAFEKKLFGKISPLHIDKAEYAKAQSDEQMLQEVGEQANLFKKKEEEEKKEGE